MVLANETVREIAELILSGEVDYFSRQDQGNDNVEYVSVSEVSGQ